MRPSDGKFFATINANDIQLYSNSAYEIETKQLTECDAKLLVDSLNNNSKVKEVPLFLQASTGVFYNYALSPLGSSIASTFFTYLFDAANNNKANIDTIIY